MNHEEKISKVKNLQKKKFLYGDTVEQHSHNPIPVSKGYIPKSPLEKGDTGGCKNACVIQGDIIDTDDLKKKVSGVTISKLEKYKQRLLEERRLQAEIKQKYGIKSLELYIIQNPAENLKVEEKIESVRYIIEQNEIKSKSKMEVKY